MVVRVGTANKNGQKDICRKTHREIIVHPSTDRVVSELGNPCGASSYHTIRLHLGEVPGFQTLSETALEGRGAKLGSAQESSSLALQWMDGASSHIKQPESVWTFPQDADT